MAEFVTSKLNMKVSDWFRANSETVLDMESAQIQTTMRALIERWFSEVEEMLKHSSIEA